MYLLDTCILSESIHPAPDLRVDAWLKDQEPTNLFTSVVVCGELRYGIERLPPGRKRSTLEGWYVATVYEGLNGRILPLDYEAALKWGELRARHGEAHFVDTQIGATALVHGLTLVTRNVKDFGFEGLKLFNPWGAA